MFYFAVETYDGGVDSKQNEQGSDPRGLPGALHSCPLGSPSLCCFFRHRPPWAETRGGPGGPAWLARQHSVSCGPGARLTLPPSSVIVLSLSSWPARGGGQMAAVPTRGCLTPHRHLPLTACPSVSLHPVRSCSLRPSREPFSLLEDPLSVTLLNSYSSFKSQLGAPLLCETCLPLSSHRPPVRLAAACPCPAPQNPSRLLKLLDLPGLSSWLGSDPLLGLRSVSVTSVSGAGSGKSRPAPQRTRSRRLWRRETSPQGSRHSRLLARTAPARAQLPRG